MHGYICAKTVFPEIISVLRNSAQTEGFKLEMDGKILSSKSAVPLVVVVFDFF